LTVSGFSWQAAESSEYGVLPQGWKAVWFAGWEMPVEHHQFMRHEQSEAGNAVTWELAVGPMASASGMGMTLPAKLLETGKRYRFSVECRVQQGFAKRIDVVGVSVWSGVQRPLWDCETGTTLNLETPAQEKYETVEVDFAAVGPCTHVYVWLIAHHAGPSIIRLFMRNPTLHLLHAGYRAVEPHGDWDVELMVSGLYLQRMFA
jgi:hypothetical protein